MKKIRIVILAICLTLACTAKSAASEYTQEDLDILSHLICGEAEGCSYEMKVSVGSVVLNRVKDDRFPDTIKDVVFQEGQYSCTWDGNYYREPSQDTIDIAKYLLNNGSMMDASVVWQAEFKQGNGVFAQIDNMYFCY